MKPNLFIALVLSLVLTSQEALCHPDGSISKAALQTVSARDQLRTLPQRSETELTSQATSAIERMKSALGELVRKYVADLPVNHSPDLKKIEAELAVLIERQRGSPLLSANADTPKFGDRVSFEAAFSPDDRQLLQVQAAFEIDCGEDTVLLIFHPEKDRWKEILTWQNPPYSAVYGAINVLSYRISPPDSDGRWYVLASHIPARCSSCWGVQHYFVLRPVTGQTKPKILFQDWGPSYDCNEAGTLAAEANSFDLRFEGNSIDVEVLIRKHVRHYEIHGDRIKRVQPIAENVRDFVDEWITAPWQLAEQWSVKDGKQRLKSEHRVFHNLEKKSKIKFGSIEPNPDTSNLTRVELWEDEYDDPNIAPTWFFSIRSEGDKFQMVDIKRLTKR